MEMDIMNDSITTTAITPRRCGDQYHAWKGGNSKLRTKQPRFEKKNKEGLVRGVSVTPCCRTDICQRRDSVAILHWPAAAAAGPVMTNAQAGRRACQIDGDAGKEDGQRACVRAGKTVGGCGV